ncbi:MAG: extracellular solute-binding protein [Hyphomicrobiaceae bacterium]|nr:extracellular solute-binding protein [Hyphomicrobiaceae bacterium]
MASRMLGRLAAVAAALALGAGAPGHGVAQTQQMTDHEGELYAAAKKEGAIVWYVSQTTTEFADLACRQFDARYPGVHCSAVRASGQVVMQRLMQEVKAGAVQADVMSSNDDTQMVILDRGGQLAEYTPENAKYMLASLIKAGNAGKWSITSVAPLGMMANKGLVPAGEAPRDWKDLLDPRWKGQIAIGHPGFSGSVGVWVVTMKKLYGWDYFEQLAKNQVQVGRSIGDGVSLVESGERKIAVVPMTLAEGSRQQGRPTSPIYPASGLILPPGVTAVMAKAPHPSAGRLFLEFLLSKDYSETLRKTARWPLRTDVPAPEGMPGLDGMRLISTPTQDVMDQLKEVQQQFRDAFGT